MIIFIEILFNLGTITTFGIISSLVGISSKNTIRRQVLHGLIFGSGTVIGMLNPVILRPGLIFDGRSVLISLSGFIFGPITALMSASMALIVRIIQGGAGVWMGSSVIIISAVVGVIFYRYRKQQDYDIPIQKLYAFGLLVHVLMLFCTIALPRTMIISTVKTIGIPVLIIYPLATVVLGKILTLILSRTYLLESVQNSEAIFRNFMDHSPIYVYFKDENIRSIRLSKNFETMLGKPIHELLGKNMDELFPSELAKKMVNDDKEVLKEELVIQTEEAFNGRFYSTIKFPIILSNNQKYLAGYTIDITERKQAEKEIKELNEQLEERVHQRTSELEKANQALESFSYSVSHDLRAPLRAIEGFSKILQEEYPDQLEQKGTRYLTIIAESVTRMNLLINGLLLISRVSKDELQKCNIDMNTLIQTYLNEVEEQPNHPTNIGFSIEKLVEGYGDPVLIRQIWVNLIENGIKFSKNTEKPLITIGSYQEDNEVVYFVKDNGVGFKQQYAKRLFTVFQRLHSPDEFSGIGLGLALIERIIHRHGGKVWAEGIEGVGATFYFSLPNKGQEVK